MNYANDEMIDVIYNRKEKTYRVKKKNQNKILQVIKQYKFVTLLITTAIAFCTINFILITSFFKLLGKL